MLPVIASVNTFNFQTPIVNTVTPGTSVVHVPYDNVAPSVSTPEANNNSNANVITAPPDEQPTVTQTSESTASEQGASASFSSLLQSSSSSPQGGVQASFVAQLAAQDNSPQTQVILVQYEQLVANSNVKYKPSNATKPLDEPSNAFSRILQTDKAPAAQAVREEAPAPITTPSPSASSNAEATIEITALQPATQPEPAPRSSKSSNSDTDNTDNAPSGGTATSNSSIPPAVINAYASTAGRVDSFTVAATELA